MNQAGQVRFGDEGNVEEPTLTHTPASPPRTWGVRSVAWLCSLCGALCVAGFLVLSAWVGWDVLHRNWQFVDLVPATFLTLAGSIVFTGAAHVLFLIAWLAEQVWALRCAVTRWQDEMERAEEQAPVD